MARKLYLHNCVHALMGYLGYRRGLQFGYEALEDPVVRPCWPRRWARPRPAWRRCTALMWAI